MILEILTLLSDVLQYLKEIVVFYDSDKSLDIDVTFIFELISIVLYIPK